MKRRMFEELLGSVREGGAILRGQQKPSRRVVIGSSGVRAIRERTSEPAFRSRRVLSATIAPNRSPTNYAADLSKVQVIESGWQLWDQDVRLIGDVDRAREAFVRRGGIDVTNFNKQVKEIQQAGYPDPLNCLVIPALSASGVFLGQHQIESIVFQ